MGRERRVTSIDVARAAGVSQTAVSLVFNGRAEGRVSAETRKLIEDTAAALGYAPNTSARVLRGGLPQVIALAVPDVRNEYFSRVCLGAEQAARAVDMAVLLVDTAHDPRWPERLVEMSRAKMFAGAIVYAEAAGVTGTLAAALDHLVLVESPVDSAAQHGKPVIDIDIADGVRQVADHLADLGHTHIGHARAAYARDTFALRAQHLDTELARLGRTTRHYRSVFDVEEATRHAHAFLDEHTDVTAVFCDDDLLAAGVYRACARSGRAIPADLSVVGFNDTDLTRYLSPELTSVTIPAVRLGEQAATALIEHVRSSSVTTSTLPLTLTVRGSTAPVTRSERSAR
jgi:LacI family transcriptional regulator/LacI family repressor for deo operon, udp, cdd, tsx, nupC, and nupG